VGPGAKTKTRPTFRDKSLTLVVLDPYNLGMNARRLLSIAFALLLMAAYSPADEADDLIKLATQGASSDAERAARLVEAAGRLPDQPAVQESFYHKAYELGVGQVKGVDAALKALDALAAMEKIDPAVLQERRVKAYRLLYARGPAGGRAQAATTLLDLLLAQGQAKVKAGRSAEALTVYREALPIATALNRRDTAQQISEELREANARSALEERAKGLQARLEANPDDLRSRQEYVLICLVDLDDPARAKAAVNASFDPALQSYVPLAAQDPQTVAPQACLELAGWYEELSAKAGRGGQLNTLGRAKAYYTRAMEAGTLNDLEKIKIEQTLQQIEARLQTAGGGKGAINLLAMVQPAKDVVSGTWKAEGRALTSDAGVLARVMLPYQVPEEYDLHVEFTRQSGGSTVCLILCHAGREFVLETGWGGGQTGFAYVKGLHIDQNETGTKFPIINGRRHSFIVQVRKAGLRVIADRRQIIAWKTDYRTLTPHSGWALPDRRCVGFGSYLSPTTFHLAELTEITGSGKRLREK